MVVKKDKNPIMSKRASEQLSAMVKVYFKNTPTVVRKCVNPFKFGFSRTILISIKLSGPLHGW